MTTDEPTRVGTADSTALAQHGTEPARATRAVPRQRVFAFLERYMLALLLLIIVAAFSLAVPDLYPTATNLRTVLGNQSVLAVAALAALVPLVAGQFDLSIGAIVGLASIATGAALSDYGLSIPIAVLVAVGIGGAAGCANGLLVAGLGINPLIATVGTASILTGLVELYTKGQAIVDGIPESLTSIGTGISLGVPRAVFIAAAIALIVWYLLAHTPFGRYLEAVGSNAAAARLVGLQVDRLIMGSFVAGGLLAGAAGALNVARSGVADPTSGPEFTLPALAAVFLGATTLHPGRFNVPGTILALFFLAASVTGLTFLQLGTWVQPVFNGTALVVGVGLSVIIARRRTGP